VSRKLSYTVFVIILSYVNISYSAAWTQKKGGNQTISTTSQYSSKKSFNNGGNSKSSGVGFTKTESNFFFEYGWYDDLTLGFNSTIDSVEYTKNKAADAVYDFRDCGIVIAGGSNYATSKTTRFDVFLRKKLYDKDSFVVSFQPLIQTPCIENSRMMSGVPDIEMRLLGGYGFKWQPADDEIIRPFAGQYHFVNVELAYRKRDSKFADQLKLDSSAGFRVNDKLLFLGEMFHTFSMGEENVSGVVANNVLYTEHHGYYTIKAQVSAIAQVTKDSSLQIGFADELFGRNSGNGTTLSGSLWYSF
jgi:hypothetical protein